MSPSKYMCSACGRAFRSITGFDAHQTMGRDGKRAICHKPGSRRANGSMRYVLDEHGVGIIAQMPQEEVARRQETT